jgi:serine protease Do
MHGIKYSLILTAGLITAMVVSGCNLPSIHIDRGPGQSTLPTVTATPSPINPTFSTIPQSNSTAISNLPDFASIIGTVRPSVVAINTTTSVLGIFGGSFTQEGAGSGWIIDPTGLIVTNNHVVEGAQSISVTLEDGRNFSADTVRSDTVSDLAVIKISATNLPTALKVGDSAKLKVGNWVVAIGNSLGEGISATIGIVSALGITASADQGETLYDLIKTDAAINPGNSGGPLVNAAGEVVGINSIKVAQVGVEGTGYAISSNTAVPIISSLITNGYVSRPWMGVGLYTVDQTAVRQLGLSVSKGVLITQVVYGGPAGVAGLKQNDVITNVDGKDVATVADLVKILRNDTVGQTVQLTYFRGANQATAAVTLIETPR